MVWTEEKLGPIIHSILNPDEEVLSLYQSKTTKSIYGCILWNNYYYKVFELVTTHHNLHINSRLFMISMANFI